MYYVVEFKMNWADEINFSSMCVMTEDFYYKYTGYLEDIIAYDEETEFGIGTNEEQEFSNVRLYVRCKTEDDLSKYFAINEIPEPFPSIDLLEDYAEDCEEEVDDED